MGKPFYLISELPFNRMAESIGANNIILKKWRRGNTAQQWFFDGVSKTIRCNKWKNYAMEIQNNGNSNNIYTTNAINSRWWQMFKYEDGMMVNSRGKVIAVDGGFDN
jgi:hypothetical protein